MPVPTFGFHSLFDSDTVTVSPAASGLFPITNLSDDRVFTVFKPTSAATSVTIKTDAGVGNTSKVDYFMMVGHDLSDPANDAGGGVSIELESSPDDAAYTSIFSTSALTDNKIVMRTFTEVDKRFFRLTLTRGSSFVPSIGQLQWGQRLDFPFGHPTGFDPQDEKPKWASPRSQVGHLLGVTRRYTERLFKVNMKSVPDSYLRDQTNPTGFQFFWDTHADLGKPFVFAWNPGNPGSFEKDSFFGQIVPGAGIRRPLRTQVDVGLRDWKFTMTGLKES